MKMSLRAAFSRIFHQGKWALKNLVGQSKLVKKTAAGGQNVIELQRHQRLIKPQQGSRLFSQIIKKYDVNSLAADLRRRAAWQFGNHGNGRLPLLSFSLLGLAMVNKPEQDDVISQTVRDMFNSQNIKLHSVRENGDSTLSVNMLEFGKSIGKGCNAAVYEARMKTDHTSIPDLDNEIQILDEETPDNFQVEFELVNHKREITLDDLSDQDIDVASNSVSSASEQEDEDDDIVIISEDDSSISSEDSFDFVTDFPVQCISPAVKIEVEDAMFGSSDSSSDHSDRSSFTTSSVSEDIKMTDKGDFDLAVKMMFNYDIDSNTDAIMHAFRKETIPAEHDVNADSQSLYKKLPPHPNIVEMQDVFVDQMPDLPDGREEYPMALPTRLNPDGQGRNKTMFILMKKYTMTLRDYLNKGDNPSIQTRCILLTQLLEGVVHLRKHGIAHRDLKSDNIFVDIQEDNTPPQLVISDFGCCLADVNYGLKIPYQTNEIDKGGIPTLMAPEIACAVPGKDSWLDYNRADLWTVGTLVYELFGMDNPFMDGGNKLDCRTYLELQLPRLPDEVPNVVKLLTESMLKRDPKQRPSSEDAANLMHIYLWFPDWLNSKVKQPLDEVINSLLILASRVLIGCHGDRLKTLDCLLWTFLRRFQLCDIKHLLNF